MIGEDIITETSPQKHSSLFEDDVIIEKKPQMYQGESLLKGSDKLEQGKEKKKKKFF